MNIRYKFILFLLILGFFGVPSIVFAKVLPDTTIQHEVVTSVVVRNRLFLSARLHDSEGLREARCYFKTETGEALLYVLMDNTSGNIYQCTLPAFTEEMKILEYFFLVVNSRGQSVRSTPFKVKTVEGDSALQRGSQPDTSTVISVYSELVAVGKDYTSIIDDKVDFVVTPHEDKKYGLQAGVYDAIDIPAFLNSMPGYFGGFVLDRNDKTIRSVKGFSVNIKEPLLPSKTLTGVVIKNDELQLKNSTCFDIAGDNWVGYFTRTDSDSKEYLTATVGQTGCRITIQTTLSDLGHYLSGNMNSHGDMLLYDAYDGEDWTTYAGPANSFEIIIYDYIYPPQLGQPEPPLNKIALYLYPKVPTEVQASDGTYRGSRIAVSWSEVEIASSYEVYACQNSTTDSCTVLAQVNTNQYDDTRHIHGIVFYRIKACNTAGCSELSDYDTGYEHLSIEPIYKLLL